MDKIYSRPRLKFPRFIPRKIKVINCIFIILVIVIILSLVSFIYASYPIFTASCETAAGSKAIEILTTEVDNIMDNYTYNELVNIQKDEKGNIILIETNTILINKIISQIIGNIQKRIDNSSTTTVYINYGSVSRNKFLEIFWTKI